MRPSWLNKYSKSAAFHAPAIIMPRMRNVLFLHVALLATVACGQTSRPASPAAPKNLAVLFVTGGEAHDFEKLAPIVTRGIAKFADVNITTRFGREALKDSKLADG